jgi:hypothetical protein
VSVIASLELLPDDGLTVSALRALDFVVPGEWNNVNRFETLVAQVAGSDSAGLAAEVRRRALAMEAADPRWSRAMAAYQLVDKVDQVAAAAAAASKVGSLFGGKLGFLQQLTPKPETTQSLDAGAKLIAELLAFGLMNGMPTGTDALAKFVVALGDYGRYDLMRMASWVVYDGLLPLGPDFVRVISGTFRDLADSALTDHGGFAVLADQLPGDTAAAKRAFVIEAIDTTGEWVGSFVADKGLTQDKVMAQLKGTLSLAEGSLDVVAAAIDASTTTYSHTGTQTVARGLARAATEQLRDEVWERYVAGL